MQTVFVPANLLDVLDRKLAGPELERRIVTAYILGGGGHPKQWATALTLAAAKALWPMHMVSQLVRNVLTVLLELEVLGVVVDMAPCEGGYMVTRREDVAA